jgi:hypothetical protein
LRLNGVMFKKCDQCGQEALFVSETVYDGFKKVGELRRCSLCGATVTAKASAAPKVDPLAALFGEDARPEGLSLFDVEAETARLCRKCKHYVVHPFTQRCGLHDKEVSATDSCGEFEAKAG